MRLQVVAGHGADDALLLVEHDVEEEVDADQAAGLVDVLAHRVALEDAGARRGRQHHAVVVADGGVGAEAGHDRLGAAAEAGEVVVLDVAGADAQVGLEVGLEDLEARAAADVVPTGTQRGGVEVEQAHAARDDLRRPTSCACSSGVCLRCPPSAKRMLMSSGGSGASSSSSAGRNLYDGQGRVTSLTTMTADARRAASSREARRADGLRQGAPDLRLLVARRWAPRGGGCLLAEARSRGATTVEQVRRAARRRSSPSP